MESDYNYLDDESLDYPFCPFYSSYPHSPRSPRSPRSPGSTGPTRPSPPRYCYPPNPKSPFNFPPPIKIT